MCQFFPGHPVYPNGIAPLCRRALADVALDGPPAFPASSPACDAEILPVPDLAFAGRVVWLTQKKVALENAMTENTKPKHHTAQRYHVSVKRSSDHVLNDPRAIQSLQLVPGGGDQVRVNLASVPV